MLISTVLVIVSTLGLKKLEKNQIINQNYVEAKLDSMSITIDKIDNNVKQISTIVDLDLKQETKEVMNSLIDKIENMNSRDDNKIPRLNNQLLKTEPTLI